MQRSNKRFSQYFDLKKTQDDLSFFDLDITDDTKLFIDPYYFSRIKDDPHVSYISRIVTSFMYDLLEFVRNNHRLSAHSMCSHFQETKGTGIGYADNKINGSGAGEVLSKILVDAMFASKIIISKTVTHLEEFTIACQGIGKDRVSDIVLSVGKLGFIKFTQAQCRKHSIPMQLTKEKLTYFCLPTKQWKSDYFELPHIISPNTLKEQYIILVPVNLLSDKVVYNPDYFLRHVVIPYFKKDAIRRNLTCVKTRKNGDKFVTNDDLFRHSEYYAVNKSDAIKFIEKYPETLEQFRRVEAPYQFNRLKAS